MTNEPLNRDINEENDLKHLRQYSIELLNDANSLTLSRLVEAHKTIRALRIKTEKERMNYVKQGYEDGFLRGLKNADSSLIPLTRLKEMTFSQIAELIYGDIE